MYMPAALPDPYMRIGVSALTGGVVAGSTVGTDRESWWKSMKYAVTKLSGIVTADGSSMGSGTCGFSAIAHFEVGRDEPWCSS